MNTFQKQNIENNKNLIEKFKRELTKFGIESIRQKATDEKHKIIANPDYYKFNTIKQRDQLYFNYFYNGEKSPENAGYFTEKYKFRKVIDNLTAREIIKIISMTDPEARKIKKEYIKKINEKYTSWTDQERVYNLTNQVHLYLFYKTLIKIELDKKLNHYLEKKA